MEEENEIACDHCSYKQDPTLSDQLLEILMISCGCVYVCEREGDTHRCTSLSLHSD